MTTDSGPAIRRVKSTVEAVKVVPRTNAAPRIVIQLSVGFQNHEDLFVFMGAQMKQEIDFTVESIGVQGSLLAALGGLAGSTGAWAGAGAGADDSEADEDEDETELVSMSVDGKDNQPVQRPRSRNGAKPSAAGAEWAPHFFALNDETPGLCGTCHYREEDAIHIHAAAGEGSDLSEAAQALIDDLAPEREAPATPEEAEARAEAEARLTAKAR